MFINFLCIYILHFRGVVTEINRFLLKNFYFLKTTISIYTIKQIMGTH